MTMHIKYQLDALFIKLSTGVFSRSAVREAFKQTLNAGLYDAIINSNNIFEIIDIMQFRKDAMEYVEKNINLLPFP